MMATRPIIVFPRPEGIPLQRKRSFVDRPHVPSFARQQERLDQKLMDLRNAFNANRAALRVEATGVMPEEVLVFQTVGTIREFQNAVRNMAGLEWLAEWDSDEIEPDEDFYVDEEHKGKPLTGILYLVMTNQESLAGIELLWRRYKATNGKALPRNSGKWRTLFEQLRDIRFWSAEDRLRHTGLLENLRFDLAYSHAPVQIEAELWFHRNAAKRVERFRAFKVVVEMSGGHVLQEAVIEATGYHGVLFELPATAAQEILDNNYDTSIVRDSAIMFFRPTGQTATTITSEDPMQDAFDAQVDWPVREDHPVVALLDGLPVANHHWLAGRLIIDDPDDCASDYLSRQREHGTAMASVILHGDRNVDTEPLKHPLYVRPIMRPSRTIDDKYEERIPPDVLPLDLIRRAFRRMFEGGDGEEPTAASVKIVNFSLGDASRQFDRGVTAWGQLFDWLSWRYNVLILVSTGNYDEAIELDMTNANFDAAQPDEIQRRLIQAIFRDSAKRRVLAPSEGINVLAVGALHEDKSAGAAPNGSIDCFISRGLLSPIGRVGPGFRRSVKPDVLMAGGRQLFTRPLGMNNDPAVLRLISTQTRPPGFRVAAPGNAQGDLAGTLYTCGTSNATALASRTAAQLLEVIEDLQDGPGGEVLSDYFFAVLLKALLIHGATWHQDRTPLEAALRGASTDGRFREKVARLVGYGEFQPIRVFSSSDQRVTLVGCGTFNAAGGHRFKLPLPQSLSNQQVWRRLTITLAWFTPVNTNHKAYRKAALSFEPSALKDGMGVGTNMDVDGHAVKRGTVQHQVFEGHAVRQFETDGSLDIQVFCQESAGPLDGQPVPYALVVTVEVAEELDLPLYQEIFERVRQPIRIIPEA